MLSLNIPLAHYKTHLWKLSHLSFYTNILVEVIFCVSNHEEILLLQEKFDMYSERKQSKSTVLGKLLRTV